MKKIALSLIALAALSGAALANDRGYELRDSDTYFGKYATVNQSTSQTDQSAFAADEASAPSSNFERVTQQSVENENSGH